MVEELVVKDALTEAMIEAGKQLLQVLDKNPEITVNAALWLYTPENNSWRFIVASPQTQKFGPKKMYEAVLSALSMIATTYPFLALTDIRVVTSDDDLIRRLHRLVVSGDDVAIRFSRGVIDGRYIEDAYIYRVN